MSKRLFHLTKISDLTSDEFRKLIELGVKVKENPEKYKEVFAGKTLLMLFAKPSLRTRVSFEVGATQLGGHAIYYSITGSPLGTKETIEDTAKVLSRYCDIVMARVKSRTEIQKLAENSTIPIINGLDDFGHPCQMLADFMTIYEKKKSFDNLKLAYYGDCKNNVTYGLMRSCALLGMEMNVVCPADEEYMPEKVVIEECEEINKKTGGKIKIVHDPIEGAKGVDVIYTDSWMSYHIPKEQQEKRISDLRDFEVTMKQMKEANEGCIFLHCLPAQRGVEVSAEVIDSEQSVVFDEAENRLHAQKAFMVWLMGQEDL